MAPKNDIPAYVLGVGLTKFIKPRGLREYPEMGYEAGVKAMLDAQINYDDVETGVACYVCYFLEYLSSLSVCLKSLDTWFCISWPAHLHDSADVLEVLWRYYVRAKNFLPVSGIQNGAFYPTLFPSIRLQSTIPTLCYSTRKCRKVLSEASH